ncbi:uncharacterized protein LOC122252265 [Penaeus japonicus]|uniref:uncharacterized protein LOC122252265 n=1 Tax=Penaeus japonicus TaxID=27405 RepID=UPI001C70F854|nr:uncharacterized protein LOC122252265 [Penaeus japonicus]
MALFMLFYKQTASWRESCERSVIIFALASTLLEVPDTIMHLLEARPSEFSFMFIHVIYRSHFALDPILFVWLNARYRQMVLRCWSSWIPGQMESSMSLQHVQAELEG